MATVLWFLGFGLMLASFTFLFGKSEQRNQPRISIDWPQPEGDEERR